MKKLATVFLALLLAGCPDSSPPTPPPAPPPAPVAPTKLEPAPVPEAPSLPAESEAPTASTTALILILDTSGSMNEKVGSDGSKIEIAKRVIADEFLPTLSDDLWVAYYEFQTERSPLRRNGHLDAPGWSHREKIMEMIEAARANGGTPIVQSLGRARDVLGATASSRKVVVLVTDGMDDKGPKGVERALDACKDAGIECYVVGFQLGEQGRYLETKLGLGKGYFKANGGRQALLDAMKSIAAAVEK
jgi:hypothetical protein